MNLKSFNEAIAFVNKIRRIAEEEGHHPDILIHAGNMVKIMLTSHHEGKITDKDYSLAQKINEV